MEEALGNVDAFIKQREADRKAKAQPKDARASAPAQAREQPQRKLERARRVFDAARAVLYHLPDARSELRDLLRAVDRGDRVDLSACSSSELSLRTQRLFQLAQLSNPTGHVFQRSSIRDEKLLPALAPALDEPPQPPLDDHSAPLSQSEEEGDDCHDKRERKRRKADGTYERASCSGHEHFSSEHVPDDKTAKMTMASDAGPAAKNDHTCQAEDQLSDAAFIGPTMGPAVGPVAPSQATVGPARPPDHVLQQAREQMDDFAGPEAPEMIELDQEATQDTRQAEVDRILDAASRQERMSTKTTSATSAQAEAASTSTAYEVLNVAEEATSRDIKKSFHKLSLLVHPDKCEHPRSKEAFDAVASAKDMLVDPASRQQVDSGIKAKRDEHALQKAWEQRVRDAQWRRARGTATADDMSILNPEWLTKPRDDDEKLERPEWMKKPPAAFAGKSSSASASASLAKGEFPGPKSFAQNRQAGEAGAQSFRRGEQG